jgi:hypothetical protein
MSYGTNQCGTYVVLIQKEFDLFTLLTESSWNIFNVTL